MRTLALLVVISAPAMARQANHNIDWYVHHHDERAAVVKLCESDHSYDRSPDCANAHSAETALWAKKTEGGFAKLDALSKDPRFTSLIGPR